MSKESPFENIPKTKLISGEYYRLHNECFNKVTAAKKEADELRKEGYAVRRYKREKHYYLYIRN